MSQKLTTCLWFDGKLDEALAYYLTVFPDSNITSSSRYPDSEPGVPGPVLVATVDLLGQEVMFLNGGPHYKLTPAASLVISCTSQAEVDHYWDLLLVGGEPSQCGWLTDQFGVSWQIVPTRLGELMSDPDPAKSGRTMQAMLGMVKLDIAGLEAAHRGDS
jgi:predicted 3-demethylubiquinone-9 3-methyltransferase (glyoxalase superfamily)